MSGNQLRILVDTNVWVDQFLPLRPGQQDSLRLVERACDVDALLLYPACILKDVFYIINSESKRLVREKLGALSEVDTLAARTYAWGCIEAIQGLALPVDTTLIDIRMASIWRNVNGDFEDNLVRAAAERAGADLVVTWDKGLLSNRVMPVVTPAQALAEIDAWEKVSSIWTAKG